MGQSSVRLDLENWKKWDKKTTKKGKGNKFESRKFKDDRYLCIWRYMFAWNKCSSIWIHIIAIWNQKRINRKQVKIVTEAIINTRTGISSSTNGSKCNR